MKPTGADRAARNPIALDLIAIDGPAGVGKSTVAKRLAERLRYYFLSSGMVYRAIAWHLMQQGWRTGDGLPAAADLESKLDALEVRVAAGGKILANGRDVTEALRSEAVSDAASILSALPAVRERSNQVQRDTVAAIGSSGVYPGVILEGRDIGTVVFPQARHKFFLTAREEIRAERRFAEQRAAHPELTLDAVRDAMRERDARDSGRAVAPLVPAPDARRVDTSDLTLEQVLERIVADLRTPRPVV
jgi:cytidylate kinase